MITENLKYVFQLVKRPFKIAGLDNGQLSHVKTAGLSPVLTRSRRRLSAMA